MNKWIKLLIILIALLLIASAVGYAVYESEDSLACTEELKVCDDGSYVGRNPDLNCEFNPCPGSLEPEG